MKFFRRVTPILLLTFSPFAFAQESSGTEVPTKVYLEALFHSGKTFSEIVAEADAHFQSKYPDLTFAELCEGEHRDGAFVKYQRWQSFWKHHLNPDGTLGDFTQVTGSTVQTKTSRGADCDNSDWDIEWNNINYTSNMGLQIDQGRTNVLAFHPSDPQTYFIGAAWGGLWKTTDGGLTHTLVNDNLPLSAVCGIAIDPDNPDNMAVALSDIVWYGPSGIGVFVSNDGGESFSPTDISWGLNENVRIYYMDQDPNDAENIIIATSEGLYKTDDFFDSNELVLDANMRSVKFSRTTDNLVFAGGSSGQLYKSEDAGNTFSLVTDFGGGHVRIAVSIVDGSEHIALTHDNQLQTSDDNGDTFDSHGLPESNMVVEFAAGSETILNVGNFEVYRSDDFGASFEAVSHWLGDDGLPFIHVDQRNVFVNPLEDDYVYFCNDGGIFRYDNAADEFDNLSTELIITQYYDIAVSQTEDLVLGGGSQDNGNIYREDDGGWNRYAQTGDGMGQDIDPVDAGIRYWSYQYGGLRRWQDGSNSNIAPAGEGGSGAWETPFKIDPNNSNRIVVGYNSVYASDDNGDTWDEVGDPVTISSDLEQLAIAPSNSDKIYATQGRRLFVKNPGVDEWTEIITPVFASITDLEVDQEDENVIYICYDGYIDEEKVYKSEDAGESWINLSANLPNLPMMSLELYYDEPGAVFVGTFGAVYYLDDSSEEWRKYGCLPNTSVNDIEIQYHTQKVFIGTHGRGIFEAPIELYVSSVGDDLENERPEITLYPNPTQNLVSVRSTGLDLNNVTCSLADMTGRIIQIESSIQANGELQMDCSQLTKGNYIVTLTDEEQNSYVLKLSVY